MATSEEFVGPFPSWSDLKREFGAVGDGVADDTNALQSALAALSVSGNSPVLYIPPGTYRITRTIVVQAANGISVIGADPATTILKWGGPTTSPQWWINGVLLHVNGICYSKISRLTFDGNGADTILIDQSLTDTGDGRFFDTGNEYSDCVFQHTSGAAILAGQYGKGSAESSVQRCKVLNCRVGIQTMNFNALDWWIWDSYFKNCAVGVTNGNATANGAGNFRIYGCVFDGSTQADIQMLNTGIFSVRDTFSINSRMFIAKDYYYSNATNLNVSNNTVIAGLATNTAYPVGAGGTAIFQGDMGPLILTDNTIIGSPFGNVLMSSMNAPDCLSMGNTFSNAGALTCRDPNGNPGRVVSVDDRTVDPSTLTYTLPPIPVPLPNHNRTVFEVPAGSNAAAIQSAIDQAAALNGQRPVVHLPFGDYRIDATITIPIGADLQLIGDGNKSRLLKGDNFTGWNNTNIGPILYLPGPARAILSNFYVGARDVVGIQVQTADQPGSRIYMQQNVVTVGLVSDFYVNLGNTDVVMRDCQLAYTASNPAVNGVALRVKGVPGTGQTSLLSGAAGANFISFKVDQGGRLLVRDFWYEGNNETKLAQVKDSSTFTFAGSRASTPPTNSNSFEFVDFSGVAAIVGSIIDHAVAGAESGRVWVVGNSWNTTPAIQGSLSGAFNLNRKGPLNSAPTPDAGTLTPAQQTTAMAQLRAAKHPVIDDLPAGVTDVRMYRLALEQGSTGIYLLGAAPV